MSYLSLETVFDKWINAKFEGKMVVSVTKKDQFTNLRLSLINGRSYTTKLGDAMSVQLAPNDLQDLIETLNEIQRQYFLRSQNG